MEAAEAEAKRLAERWLQWFRDQGSGIPHVCRIDFLVALQPATENGADSKFEVYTVELTECGAATCGLPVHPRSVAVLNECLVDDVARVSRGGAFPTGFPLALPPMQKPE